MKNKLLKALQRLIPDFIKKNINFIYELRKIVTVFFKLILFTMNYIDNTIRKNVEFYHHLRIILDEMFDKFIKIFNPVKKSIVSNFQRHPILGGVLVVSFTIFILYNGSDIELITQNKLLIEVGKLFNEVNWAIKKIGNQITIIPTIQDGLTPVWNLFVKELSLLPWEPIIKQLIFIYNFLKNIIQIWVYILWNYILLICGIISENIIGQWKIIYNQYNWLLDPIMDKSGIAWNYISINYDIVTTYISNGLGYITPESTVEESLLLWNLWVWGILTPILLILTWEFNQYACMKGGEHHAFVKIRRDFPQYWQKWHVTGDDAWHYITFLVSCYIIETQENHGYIIVLRNFIRQFVHTNRIYGEEQANLYRQFDTLGNWWLDPETSGRVVDYQKWGPEPWQDIDNFVGRAPRYGKEWSWWADGCFTWGQKKLWYFRYYDFDWKHKSELAPIIVNISKKIPELFNHERVILWQLPFITERNLNKQKKMAPSEYILSHFSLNSKKQVFQKKMEEDIVRAVSTINWELESMDSRHHMAAYTHSKLYNDRQPKGFPKSITTLGRQWYYYTPDLLQPQTLSKGGHLQSVNQIRKKLQKNFTENHELIKKIISPDLFWKTQILAKNHSQIRDPWFSEWNHILKTKDSVIKEKNRNILDMYLFVIGNGDAQHKLHLEIWNKIELQRRFFNQYWIAIHYPSNLEIAMAFFDTFTPF